MISRPALLLAMLSALALGGAFLSQYGFGLKPCILCIWQRWPHAAVIALGLASLPMTSLPMTSLPMRRQSPRVILALQALSLAVCAGIAAYHMGVEWHWWAGTAECTGGEAAASVEELRRQLLGTKPARCDEAPFVFLGLSMAGWNFLYSLAGAALAVFAIGRMKALSMVGVNDQSR